MAVRIYIEIGHEASIRNKKTQEGFTHDWEVFVRGCDGAEIQYFIEKVVFYLHETFPKPKRVIKEPPYTVKESGYAGFNLPIDIYLRNNNEPKKIRFNYDLHLQTTGPPIIKVQKEKYIFNSPTDDFKMKLLKGGGIIGSSSSTQDTNDSRSSIDDKNQMTNKPKLSGSDLVKKQKIKIGEPSRDFHELFGSPIIATSKTSFDQKSQSKPESKVYSLPKQSSSKIAEPTRDFHELFGSPLISSSKSGLEEKSQAIKQDNKAPEKSRPKHSPHKDSHKEKFKDKSDSDKKKDEKKQKDKSKDRERSSKDKSVRKEKSPRPKSPSPPKRSPKRSTSPRFPSPSVKQHKESKHNDKEKRESKDERRAKKEKRNKDHKENKHGGGDEPKTNEDHKEKEGKSRSEVKKEANKIKTEHPPSSPPLPPKPVEKKEKIKEKSALREPPKEEKPVEKSAPEKYKHKKKDKEKRDKKEDKPPKADKKEKPEKISTAHSLIRANLFKVKKDKPFSNAFVVNVDESSNSSSSSSNSSSVPEKKIKIESTLKIKEEKIPKSKKEKVYQENAIKCKRKSNSVEPDEPPEKITKEVKINNNSDEEQEEKVIPKMEENYFGVLRELQHKIMELKDNSDLQKVVQLIAETGRYEVSAHTFDFDLCLLDRDTVQQLQNFFVDET